jgi:hypothetical protein
LLEQSLNPRFKVPLRSVLFVSVNSIAFPHADPGTSALAQSALEFPTVAGASDGDDVEIEALRRIAFRYERDRAEKFIGAVVVTFGLQDVQALSWSVLPADASRS